MIISSDIKKNIDYIKTASNENKDLIIRTFAVENTQFAVCFINEQTNEERIEENVIKPLLKKTELSNRMQEIKNIITLSEIKDIFSIYEASDEIMKGNAVLFIDGVSFALCCVTVFHEKRAVVEPPNSAVTYGPREGFVESIKTNTNLIRKRLPSSSLKIEEMMIGKYTKSMVKIFYLNDIADRKNVKKLKKRIATIDIDGIIDANYLVSYLEERKGSIFKQVGKTEKPDIAVAKMLEGRITIMVDGSPVALTVPFILIEDLQNSEDYYERSFRAAFSRVLRLVGVLFSILLPGIYVAIQLYHYRIIPIKFLVTMMNSSHGIPFTPFLEMLFVILLFEILFEASLRMPQYYGVALSVVGALVLGDTAVKAGLISSPAVMIIALTGISFYTIPDETAQMSILRIFFTLVGGTAGIAGIISGGIFLLTYLVEFNSYGSPYLAPYAPYIKADLKDGIFKKQGNIRQSLPRSILNRRKKGGE